MDGLKGFLMSRDVSTHSKEYLEQDMSANILGATGFFCFLSIIVVSLRLYARAFMVRRLGWEDLLIFITGLFVLGCWICFIGESKSGVLGRHMVTVTIPQYELFLLWTFPHQLFLTLGVGTFKCSVGFFLVRVGRSKRGRWALYGLMGITTVISLVYASTLFWSCIPLRANWHFDEQKNAKMISIKVWKVLAMWNSLTNMVTDSILAVWPMPIVLRMKVSTFKKISLVVALSLGWLAVVCGAIKTWSMWNYFDATDKYYKDTYFFWSFMEMSVGTIAASVPLLQPLVYRIRRSGSSKGDSGQVVAMPLPVAAPATVPRARIRRPVITWTGMGFTEDEDAKYEVPGRSGSSTRIDMERSDSGTIFVGYEGSKAFVPRGGAAV
ncbi:hypothetical protein E4T48_00579 [Aureobasidium sp. EXF-10727]|nr:hypothetical protein E4T48_00579 [Aureobasidium sp. EXF-10727]